MRRLSWGALALSVVMLAGCGGTKPVKKQQAEKAEPAQTELTVLEYKAHPRIDKISLWHKQGLTTGQLKAYDSFVMVPAVLATEEQVNSAKIQVVNASIVQAQMPSMVANAMHPRYEMAWEEGPNRMAIRIVLLASAAKPEPETERNYLPVTMVLATPSEDDPENPEMRRITVAAAAIRIDLFDAVSKERILSLVDNLDEVKTAWQQEEQSALIDFEQLVRHWAVKVRFNLDSLQDADDQPLSAG